MAKSVFRARPKFNKITCLGLVINKTLRDFENTPSVDKQQASDWEKSSQAANTLELNHTGDPDVSIQW